MTSNDPHLGAPLLNMSLSTANLIHSWAMPVLLVGAALTLAGALGVFLSDAARNRQAIDLLASRAAASAGAATQAPPSGPPTVGPDAALAYISPRPQTPVPDPAATSPASPPAPEPETKTPAETSAETLAAAADLKPPVQPPVQAQAQIQAQPLAEVQAEPQPAVTHAAWKPLDPQQRARMVQALWGVGEDVWFVTQPDPAAERYAHEIGEVFREAGWTDHHALVLHPGHPLVGLSSVLRTTPVDRVLSKAFAVAGLPVAARTSAPDEPTPTIYIGAPPPAMTVAYSEPAAGEAPPKVRAKKAR